MGVLFVFGFVMAVWIGFFCLFLRASAPEQPPSIQQENKNAECKKRFSSRVTMASKSSLTY